MPPSRAVEPYPPPAARRRRLPLHAVVCASLAAFFAPLPSALADDVPASPDDVSASADDAAAVSAPKDAITACLAEIGIVAVHVEPSAIAGLHEVEAEGGTYLHVAGEDCRHLIVGDLYEKRGDRVVGLTNEKRTSKQRARLLDAMAQVPASEVIAFKPAGDPRAVVSVFTDTDCGYCRKLHAAMDDYHALGIEVRYLAFPRAGLGSRTYDKMVSAWCADDPQAALTALKRGEGIPSRTCAHPVGKQHAIAQKVGLTGTPALVLEDGTVIPGFLEADALAARIGL